MAFGGFGNPPTAMNSGAGGAGGAVTQGADLEVIQTEVSPNGRRLADHSE